MQFQILAARISFAAFLVGAAIALTAVAGVRLGLFAYATGFELMYPAVFVGFIAFLAGAAFCYTAFQRNEGDAKRIGLAGFLGSILLLYPPVTTQVRGLFYPPINDAATDSGDPPRFVTLAKLRKPGMNPLEFDSQKTIRFRGEEMSVAVALHDYYMDVNGPGAKLAKLMPGNKHPAATLFWRCFASAAGVGWHIVDYSEKEGRIEATDTSFWFGQVADIVIRIRPSGIGARYDVRSQSREGATDNGENLMRLKAFIRKMD